MIKPVKLVFQNSGPLTTIQDKGRCGFQQYGVPVSGAMDIRSAILANLVLQNPAHNPVIEFTLSGPLISFEGDCRIAISGAGMSPKINGKFIAMNRNLKIRSGDVLSFGELRKGCRGYLAVGGKWMITPWLKSFAAVGIEFPGNIMTESYIKKGSILEINPNLDQKGIAIPKRIIATVFDHFPVRLVPGPEYHLLSQDFLEKLFSKKFTISAQSNRMGYRMRQKIAGGPMLENMVSTGLIPGTVQLSGGENLIILMKDAHTTGGYPRIAQIITADMDRLGQMKPGDQISFELVSLKEAKRALNTLNWNGNRLW